MARNLFNIRNDATPSGNLSSPNFGKSTSIMAFGPGGGSAQRVIMMSASFNF
jgi:hypothetical protein